jgi:hypothetical protein
VAVPVGTWRDVGLSVASTKPPAKFVQTFVSRVLRLATCWAWYDKRGSAPQLSYVVPLVFVINAWTHSLGTVSSQLAASGPP